MNTLLICFAIVLQNQSPDIVKQEPDHPGSFVIVTNSAEPKGISELEKARKVEDIRALAVKNGYDVFEKHQGLFVFEPSVLNLKALKLRCDLIKSLGKLSGVPYWIIDSSQFNSPVVKELLKCFAGDRDFTGQEKNQNAKLSIRCNYDITVTDGKKHFDLYDPSMDDSFSDCFFNVDPALNHDALMNWQVPFAFEPCPVDLSKMTIHIKTRSNDIRDKLHLLDDANAVIREQTDPYLRTMDEADSMIDNAFRGAEDFRIDSLTKFSDLPQSLKDRLTKYVQDHYKDLGLQSPGDSTEFLQKMRIKSLRPKLFVAASMLLPNGGRKTGRIQISLGGN